MLKVLGRKVASNNSKTRITTDRISPGVQKGGSNSKFDHYLRYLQVVTKASESLLRPAFEMPILRFPRINSDENPARKPGLRSSSTIS